MRSRTFAHLFATSIQQMEVGVVVLRYAAQYAENSGLFFLIDQAQVYVQE